MIPDKVNKLIKLRQEANSIESEIKEVAMAWFNLNHRYSKEILEDADEYWGIKRLNYHEDYIEVSMYWSASWAYGGFDEGYYSFQMDYHCLEMNESELILKEEKDRKETERLQKIEAEIEAIKLAEINKQKQEEKDIKEYQRLKNKFGD